MIPRRADQDHGARCCVIICNLQLILIRIVLRKKALCVNQYVTWTGRVLGQGYRFTDPHQQEMVVSIFQPDRRRIVSGPQIVISRLFNSGPVRRIHGWLIRAIEGGLLAGSRLKSCKMRISSGLSLGPVEFTGVFKQALSWTVKANACSWIDLFLLRCLVVVSLSFSSTLERDSIRIQISPSTLGPPPLHPPWLQNTPRV